jgi:hypothetical protein
MPDKENWNNEHVVNPISFFLIIVYSKFLGRERFIQQGLNEGFEVLRNMLRFGLVQGIQSFYN